MELKAEKRVLSRPVPRIPSDGSLEGLLLVFTVVWIFGSLLAIFFAAVTVAPGWYRYWRLSRAGEITTGQLIRRDEGVSWYAYLYQFNTRPAPNRRSRTFIGQHAVGFDHAEPLGATARIAIRYLVSNPQISVIEQYFTPPSTAPLLFFGLAAISLFGGLLLLPARWKKWHTLHRLHSQGQRAAAKISHRWRVVDDKNRDQYCVAYRFTLALPGRLDEQTIEVAEINRMAYLTLAIGDTSPVKFLPDQPDCCCLDMEPLLRRAPKKGW